MKPILFNLEMVQAILDGRKIQTRRPIKPQVEFESGYDYPHENELGIFWKNDTSYKNIKEFIEDASKYQVGDILYVRETWQEFLDDEVPIERNRGPEAHLGKAQIKSHYYYRADGELEHPKYGKALWRPSIHMPKEAARLFLKVTDVRVERLQDMKEVDAKREGVNPWMNGPYFMETYLSSFRQLWNNIYTDKGFDWVENPWVWVYTFERCEKS